MTTNAEHDAFVLLKKIRYDLSALQAKVTELATILGKENLKPPVEHRCKCGLDLRSQALLAEHTYLAHDGPVPNHWQNAELLAREA